MTVLFFLIHHFKTADHKSYPTLPSGRLNYFRTYHQLENQLVWQQPLRILVMSYLWVFNSKSIIST